MVLFAFQMNAAPKTKTFQNAFVNNTLQANSLFISNNATINGDLAVNGNIIGSTENSGLGNVQGPATSTPHAVVRFADSSGDFIENSVVLIDDTGNVELNGITKNGNTISWPSIIGSAGTFLSSDGAGNLVYATPSGSGNVSTALPFSTNNAIVVTDLPNGVDNIKQSSATVDSSGNISNVNNLTANSINAPTIMGNASSATTAVNFSGSLAGDVGGTQNATIVNTVGGQTALNVASGAVLANNATSNNTASTIVRRDGSGNFSAGTIAANLTGNVTGNVLGNVTGTASNATNAVTAVTFSGTLNGDVGGTQSATVINTVGGQTASSVAAATVATNAATDTNTPNTIVKRDASGNFIAGTITANLNGNVIGNVSGNSTTATNATNAVNFTGPLVGDVTGNQTATIVSTVGGQAANSVAAATLLANGATSTNSPSTLIRRDGSGNFSAGTITANLAGNATTATSATTAGTATNFSGSLSGDVNGTQSATIVNTVGGKTSNQIAQATDFALTATPISMSNSVVLRDASGNFAANVITASINGNATSAITAVSSTNFTGSLSGDVGGTQRATVVNAVGGQTASSVALATIAANAATNSNTPNTIVLRDSSGNFVAGTISANLIGDVTGNLSGNATTATNAVSSINFTGPLIGDVSGTQGATVVNTVGGQTASAIASATVLANAATSNNTASTIVRRDSSGNFTAGVITASLVGNVAGNVTGNLSGNATTATTATNATTAVNFTGSLNGDVIGTQGATIVNSVGGQSAANIATATTLALTATNINTPNAIVRRDAAGNFITNMITISGTTTNGTDVATKSYVDNAVATGFTVKEPAIVVSTTNVSLSGLQTIDGVALTDGDRVLLVDQTNPVENGLWVAHAGAWTRPVDFASGTQAGTAYVLILSGTTNAGTSWVSTTPTAIIDTDPIEFAQFSLAEQTTAANVGTGAGQFFRDKTGNTINLKTLAAGSHITVTNNPNDITISTDATSTNSPNTIVSRDAAGNFSAGTITAALTGAASQNVLKTGDTMTGNLTMASQSAVLFQDSTGGNFVGLRAPSTIGTSYTIDLPSAAPSSGQVLQATSPTATQWAVLGGSPTTSKTYYVALNGNDTNDGSFGAPFRTVSHAIAVANTVASGLNPIAVKVGAGLFLENNSGGPIAINRSSITVQGFSELSTLIIPTTPSNDLFAISVPSIQFMDMALDGGTGSTAHGFVLTTTAAGITRFDNITVSRFNTAFSLNAAGISTVIKFGNVLTLGNATSISASNIRLLIQDSAFFGPISGTVPINSGISVTGINTLVTVLSCSFRSLQTAINVSGGANFRLLGSNIENSVNSILGTGAAVVAVVGCNFIRNSASSVNVLATDPGTSITLDGCQFQCDDSNMIQQGTAVRIVNGAFALLDSCAIENAVIGIECGDSDDASTTILRSNGSTLENCLTDIVQSGASTLRFVGGIFNTDKITIENPTNVTFASFDNAMGDSLTIGNSADSDQLIEQILNGQAVLPNVGYKSNYYGSKGLAYINPNNDSTFNATQAALNNAYYYVVTQDRAKEAGIKLISDTANIGNGDNVRGWSITKVGTSGDLAFTYTNNDTSGLAARGPNVLMNLDGFNNQLLFPTATQTPLPSNSTAKLVWGDDTTLYRSAANTLKTDGNLVVGALNSAGVVHTDANGLLLTSLIVNADISSSAAISDDKLATISTSGKVANSATTATSANTPNSIVARDGSGNFSAGTITAALTGAASQNVLKIGDTMTGNLNMALQSEVRFQDGAGSGNFVGLRAPTTVGSSYTVDLPVSAPVAGQVLQATSSNGTQWASVGGLPVAAKTYYVSLAGSDSNNGSFSAPFRTVSHAVQVANGVASSTNPIVISIGAGIFIEDNSGGPITITADGINIVGEAISGTIIQPTTLTVDLFLVTTPLVQFFNLKLDAGTSGSTANGITVMTLNPGIARFDNLSIYRFQTAFNFSASSSATIMKFDNMLAIDNGVGIFSNNVRIFMQSSAFVGSLTGPSPANTGMLVTGTNAILTLMDTSFRNMQTGLHISGGASVRVIGNNFERNVIGLLCDGASVTQLVGSAFSRNVAGSVNVIASDANTTLNIDGCNFDGNSDAAVPQGTVIECINSATIFLNSSEIINAVVGIQCGAVGASSATTIKANSVTIQNCATHIQQVGNATLRFVGGLFDSTKVGIANPTNITIAAFDSANEEELSMGDLIDNDQRLYQILNGEASSPNLAYRSSYYGNKGTVFVNDNNDSTFNATQAALNNANYYVVTQDRTKEAGINLISDTGNVGVGDNIRGWGINKIGTSADLAFTYTNNDTSGQAARGSNTVMNLDGFNNQVTFPTATQSPLPTNTTAKLVWGGDTNLYRAAVGLLKTDGNLAIAGIAPGSIVVTNSTSTLSASLTTTTELGYLLGVTSPIQTQLDNKVNRSGDTMMGALQLPAGSTASPSLNFTGSNTTGLSANGDNLSLSTAGAERFKISPLGVVSINNLSSAGVVHNDASGNLSSSLIVNADISPSAGIVDTKLATISTAGKVTNSATTATNTNTANAIVSRDASGNFSASNISLNNGLTIAAGGASITGNITEAGNIVPLTDNTFTLGTPNFRWANVYALNITTSTQTISGQSTFNTLLVTGTSRLMGAVTMDNNATIGGTLGVTGNTLLSTLSTSGLATLNSINVTNNETVGGTLGVTGNAALSTLSTSGLATLNSASVTNNASVGGTMGVTGLTTLSGGASITGNITESGNILPNADNTRNIGAVGTRWANIFATNIVSTNETVSGQGTFNTLLVTGTSRLTGAVTMDNNVTVGGTLGVTGNTSLSTLSTSGLATLNSATVTNNSTVGGILTVAAGSATAPSIQFTGSTNTGFSAATANRISFDTSGIERMSIATSVITTATFITANINANQAIQSVTPTSNGSVAASATTSILILKNAGAVTNFTITFPQTPTDGQYFTILQGSTGSTSINNAGGGATVVNGITGLNPAVAPTAAANGAAVTYYYSATANTWYRFSRG